ncbi:3 beta-hydroxysteroid dehydrogenase/Delta 5--_4-isomerase type 1 isoform X2 [Phymastichus coffea]|uniref:3 beta-hydroxysteroid dehydrogenase/Delta 5-->4-isomerase type 1 isoform X2 n=1 Tax=Phymastichus coffea TaxID=108790 RepID=UPI00273C68F2|nr:3 beta-hydroxysteroid dehydrogenase/Delta 5-->4-isomerase type 1 isoform X2 [Phymastichus coffea]
MDHSTGEVVVLTGSSGFLGSRILRYLVEDEQVSEIRAVDKLIPHDNDDDVFGYKESEGKVRLYHGDLVSAESCRDAFRGADVVLHCAALVDYDYPPDVDELRKNNIFATENVIKLCIEENVPRLVHCSTTEVTLQPCFTGSIVAISIYKQESKLEVPSDSKLIFGDYAATKLRAEQIVLESHGSPLRNGAGTLSTSALRPTLMYGEGDPHLLPKILSYAKSRGGRLPRFWGTTGKQQITYVGNAAWAFIKAKDTLRETPLAIAGLPVTVTDDTVVDYLALFCEHVTDGKVRVSSWPLPLALSYLGALLFEFLSRFGLISKIQPPTSSVYAFLGSILLYNRARASIHMNYWPKYKHDEAVALAAKYYSELYAREQ